MAAVAVLAALGLAGCAGAPTAPAASPSDATTAAPRASSAATASPRPTTPTTGPTSPAPDSAEHALAPFVEAARAADVALRHAATHIDGTVREDAVVLDDETVAAVQAVDLAAVREAIPAGLAAPVLVPVLTVYSDLVSRRAAMAYAGVAATTYPRPGTEADELLACLGHGSPAAARFDADLEALGAAARTAPPPGAVAPGARAGADLAARLEEIDLRNSGCAGCGGYVATALSPVVWDGAAPGATVLTGTVGGTRVDAVWTAADGWTATLDAC
ncbi:hypothetical protein [Actinotalea solisilvae]|uniref:hypothetical protein n=1 Tax=Actinotalea solisilvae TaxID=2072922 RepID=UPI0018F163EB|nr:hypothetical protein [Actinotalea solisilvae]